MTECEDLFLHFQHRNLDALVASVRTTLDQLRKRITTRYTDTRSYLLTSMHRCFFLLCCNTTMEHNIIAIPT